MDCVVICWMSMRLAPCRRVLQRQMCTLCINSSFVAVLCVFACLCIAMVKARIVKSQVPSLKSASQVSPDLIYEERTWKFRIIIISFATAWAVTWWLIDLQYWYCCIDLRRIQSGETVINTVVSNSFQNPVERGMKWIIGDSWVSCSPKCSLFMPVLMFFNCLVYADLQDLSKPWGRLQKNRCLQRFSPTSGVCGSFFLLTWKWHRLKCSVLIFHSQEMQKISEGLRMTSNELRKNVPTTA